jgi:uncharacterized protein
MRALVIAIHDVSPSTVPAAERWRECIARVVEGPVSLLLVPRHRGRESWRAGPALGWAEGRARAGDELVLHGYTHTRPNGRDGRELAGRGREEVAGLIRDGRMELRTAGLDVAGFIAPSYSHPYGVGPACRAAGLRWWAGRSILDGESGHRLLPSVGLGASSALRRLTSPAASRAAVRLLSRAPAVRLDLHPADLDHPRLEAAGRDLLARLLDQGRRPVTHATLGGLRLRASDHEPGGSGADESMAASVTASIPASLAARSSLRP